MSDVDRDNILNEEQDSSQSTGSNSSNVPGSPFLKSSVLRPPSAFAIDINGRMSSSNAQNNFNLKPSVLKPSHFSFGSGAAKLNSADEALGSSSENKLLNPFLKAQASLEEESSSEVKPVNQSTNSSSNDKIDPLTQLSRSTMPKSNLFANVKSSITDGSGFVFGQNVHERVTGENIQNSDNNSSASNLNSSGSNLLFSSGLANNSNDGVPNENDSDQSKENESQSLSEAARKYEESRAQKRKFEEVETITGEEDERNVVEINCKLFTFINSNWEERGHGMLRLNDKNKNESRVVFRQAGNLRVLINTKVWAGMIAEQSSPKSLRITAIDSNGQIKVFLVMTRPDVISKLHKALTERIKLIKTLTEKETAQENNENTDDNNAPLHEGSDDPSPKKKIGLSS